MALSHSLFDERITLTGFGKSVLFVGLGALASGVPFVWLATYGPVHSVEPAFGSVALRVAGADRLFVIAYIGVGLTRLYLTAIPLLLVLAGIVTALTGRRWSAPVAVLLGVAAAGTLTVLTGCNCGSGSTKFLAEQVVQRIGGGTGPLVVG
jgi:hypothetical protein